MKFNLAGELKKGAHYFDMSQIHEQLTQAPRPLLENMQRSRLDECQAIPDQEPKVTAQVRKMVQDVIDGTPHTDDYTTEAWNEMAPALKSMQAQLKAFGPFVSATLVGRGKGDGMCWYRYRIGFEKRNVLQRFVFDGQEKLASSRTEDLR